jgi:hypothetical protein
MLLLLPSISAFLPPLPLLLLLQLALARHTSAGAIAAAAAAVKGSFCHGCCGWRPFS